MVKVVWKTQNLKEAQNRKFVNVKMNNVEAKFQLDTGNHITIIHEKTWENICEPKLTKIKKVASGVWEKKKKFPRRNYV